MLISGAYLWTHLQTGKYFLKVTGGSATPNFNYLLEIVGAIKVKTDRALAPREAALWLTAWLKDYLQKYPKPTKTKSHNSKKVVAKREAIDTFVKKKDVEEFRSAFRLDDDTVYDEITGWLTDVHSIFDPIAVRVKHSRQELNLGVISLGKNHWADDPHYVCVTVAGLNPFGTVGALRALVYSQFKEHPCGGILNAVLPQDSSVYFKFTDADFDWITDKYSIADLKARLGRIQKDNRKSRGSYHAFHGEEYYFNQYAEFVRSFDG